MRHALRVCVLALSCSLCGCAGKPAAKAPSQVSIVAPPAPRAVALPMTPVARPKGVLALVRVHNLWAALGFPDESPVVDSIEGEMKKDVGVAFEHWDRNAPLEAVVKLDQTKPFDDWEDWPLMAAFSVGLTDLEPGWLRDAGFERLETDLYRREDCIATRSLGSAKARLVCATSYSDAQALYPYMTRGLPTESLSDRPLFAQLSLAPLRKPLSELLDEFDAEIPEATAIELQKHVANLARAMVAEARAWVNSLDRVTLVGGSSSNGSLDVDLSLESSRPSPWLISALERRAAQESGPPEPFWQLPPDASSAGFSYGLMPDDSRHLWSFFNPMVESGLEFARNFGVPNLPLLERGAEFLKSPCFRAESASWASGVPKAKKPPAQGAPINDFIARILGWNLMATPDAAECAKLGRELFDWVIDEKLIQQATAAVPIPLGPRGKSTQPLPVLIQRIPKGPRVRAGLRWYRISLSKEVLKKIQEDFNRDDDFAMEMDEDDEGPQERPRADEDERPPVVAAPTGPLQLYLLMDHHSGAEWFAFGADKRELERRLAATREAARMAEVPETASFKELGLLSGQFEKLGYWVEMMRGISPQGDALAGLVPERLHQAAFTSSMHVAGTQAGTSVTLHYSTPSAIVDLLRTWASYDQERFRALFEMLERALDEVE